MKMKLSTMRTSPNFSVSLFVTIPYPYTTKNSAHSYGKINCSTPQMKLYSTQETLSPNYVQMLAIGTENADNAATGVIKKSMITPNSHAIIIMSRFDTSIP